MAEDLKKDLEENAGLNEAQAIEVLKYVQAQSNISTSLLQRKFLWGYNKAGRVIDQLEKHKIVSPLNGTEERLVLISNPDMKIFDLISELSLIGIVETCKNDFVFTLLMTSSTQCLTECVFQVMELVLHYVTDKPNIEVLKNEENYILIVLKP